MDVTLDPLRIPEALMQLTLVQLFRLAQIEKFGASFGCNPTFGGMVRALSDLARREQEDLNLEAAQSRLDSVVESRRLREEILTDIRSEKLVC